MGTRQPSWDSVSDRDQDACLFLCPHATELSVCLEAPIEQAVLFLQGKEFETRLKEKKPGDLSDELRISLGMPVGPVSVG